MNLYFHKQFKKQLKKLDKKKRDIVQKRMELFLENPFNETLRNHPLRGKYLNYRSINITGDMRAIFKQSDDSESIVFVALGSHSKLYS